MKITRIITFFSILLLYMSNTVFALNCTANFTSSVSGKVVTFTSTSTSIGSTNNLMYTWNFGDGFNAYVANPTHTYASNGSYTVTLTIIDSTVNCFNTKTATVFVGNSTGGNCTANFTSSISGSTVTFTNTSLNGNGSSVGLTYSWNFGDGSGSALANPSHTYASNGVYSVTLTITDSIANCTQVKSSSVIVNNTTCTANFTSSVSGLTATFVSTSVIGVSTGTTYIWNFGDGSPNSYLMNTAHTYAASGTYNVSLTIINTAISCTNVKTVAVTVGNSTSNCVANFTSSVSGTTVVFTNTSLNANGGSTGLTYSWNYGDGTGSVVTNPAHVYAASGTYTVTLTIIDSVANCTKVKTAVVTVGNSTSNCVANFTSSVSGTTVTFTNTSLNANGGSTGLTYSWVFGDGTGSALANPAHAYASNGTYTVTLTITDSVANCTKVKTAVVTVGNSTSNCVANFTSSISGSTVTFTNTSSNSTSSGTTYIWSFGDGTSSYIKNPSHTYASSGTYTVSLTIIDSSVNCFNVKTTTLVIAGSNSCSANFTSVISGNTATFTNTSTGATSAASYIWNFGDGTSSNIKNPSHTYASSGTYTVSLTIIDSSVNCFNVKTIPLVIAGSNTCSANFNYTISGFSVSFTNTSTGATPVGASYIWSFGDGSSSNTMNPAHTYVSNGTYIVSLTIIDSSVNCSNTKTSTIVINNIGNNCIANFTKSISGSTVTFTNTSLSSNGSANNLTYLWSFGDGTSSSLKNPSHNYTSNGVFMVSLSIFDSMFNCSKTKTDTFQIITSPTCSASFFFGIDTTMAFNIFIVNTSIVNSGTTYLWDFGDGSPTSTMATPTHAYNQFGKYRICLTIASSACTSTYCDSIGMDSTGHLYKQAGFGVIIIDKTTSTSSVQNINELTNDVSIYPNPTNHDITVNFSNQVENEMVISLVDLTGKTIMSKKINTQGGENKLKLDLSELNSSVYFLHISSEKLNRVYKIIKD